ncbi:MAG: hypothetical protein GC186_07730 [Rhodobacteraceae bacterium]|nr:hypothetical protein [Paracoccaceae bacterium]
MSNDVLYVPFPRDLYDDIVRFSDGRLNPVILALEQLDAAIQRGADTFVHDWFEDRTIEFLSAQYPEILEEWKKDADKEKAAKMAAHAPLIWKEVSIPAGSEVRMLYDGRLHFGSVKEGKICDESGSFSPSEWASKVASGTSRNAWRDLWFKFPRESEWVSALMLRERARKFFADLKLEINHAED